MITSFFWSLRPNQWIKNLLLFAAPFFAGNLFLDVKVSTLSFVSFCTASSLGYIINDWNDRERDQLHPKKRNRPFASGALGVKSFLVLTSILAFTTLLLALQISPEFLFSVSIYLAVSLSYTFFLKTIPIVELFAVALGFFLRPIAGAVATQTYVSNWFLLTTFFGALFLVVGKRRAELLKTPTEKMRLVRSVLSSYTNELLVIGQTLTLTATLMSYSIWILEKPINDYLLLSSVVPFALALLRYVWNKDIDIESPESAIFADPIVLLSSIITLLLIFQNTYMA